MLPIIPALIIAVVSIFVGVTVVAPAMMEVAVWSAPVAVPLPPIPAATISPSSIFLTVTRTVTATATTTILPPADPPARTIIPATPAEPASGLADDGTSTLTTVFRWLWWVYRFATAVSSSLFVALLALKKWVMLHREESEKRLMDSLSTSHSILKDLLGLLDNVTNVDFKKVIDQLVADVSAFPGEVRDMGATLTKELRAKLETLNGLVNSLTNLIERLAPLAGNIKGLGAQLVGIDDRTFVMNEDVVAIRKRVDAGPAHTAAQISTAVDTLVGRLDASALASSEDRTAKFDHVARSMASMEKRFTTLEGWLKDRDALFTDMVTKLIGRIQRSQDFAEERFTTLQRQIDGLTQAKGTMGGERVEDVPERLPESTGPPSEAPATTPPAEEPSQTEGLELTTEEATEVCGEPMPVAAVEEEMEDSPETPRIQDPAPAIGDLSQAPGLPEKERAEESAPAAQASEDEQTSLGALLESELAAAAPAEDAVAPDTAGTMGQSGTVPTLSLPAETAGMGIGPALGGQPTGASHGTPTPLPGLSSFGGFGTSFGFQAATASTLGGSPRFPSASESFLFDVRHTTGSADPLPPPTGRRYSALRRRRAARLPPLPTASRSPVDRPELQPQPQPEPEPEPEPEPSWSPWPPASPEEIGAELRRRQAAERLGNDDEDDPDSAGREEEREEQGQESDQPAESQVSAEAPAMQAEAAPREEDGATSTPEPEPATAQQPGEDGEGEARQLGSHEAPSTAVSDGDDFGSVEESLTTDPAAETGESNSAPTTLVGSSTKGKKRKKAIPKAAQWGPGGRRRR